MWECYGSTVAYKSDSEARVRFGSFNLTVRFGSGSVVKLFGFVRFGSEWP